MPYSATERFARTYTPRVPDDSYDSLGGTDIPDSIIEQMPERPFHYVSVSSGFQAGTLVQTIVPCGQLTQFNIAASFTSGQLTTQAIGAVTQLDKFAISAAMAGGTLH